MTQANRAVIRMLADVSSSRALFAASVASVQHSERSAPQDLRQRIHLKPESSANKYRH
jgi:hypothetical protein